MTGVAQAEWDAWVADGTAKNPADQIRQAIDLLVTGLADLDRPGALSGRRRHARR